MKSNLVALFIAAILCVSLLCGCTTRTPVADPGATDGTESTTADSDATDTVSPQTEPAVTDTTETTPPETEPNVTEPPQTEPSVTEPAETESNVTEPQETEPSVTEPAETETNDDPPREEVIPDSIDTELTDDGYIVRYTPTFYTKRLHNNNRLFSRMPYEVSKHFRETGEEIFYTQICNNGVFRISYDGDFYLQSVTHGNVTYTYPEDRICSAGDSEFYAFEADGLFILNDCYEHILIFTDTEVIRISPFSSIGDDVTDVCMQRFYLGEDGHLHYFRVIWNLWRPQFGDLYYTYFTSPDQYFGEDGIVTLSDGVPIYTTSRVYTLRDHFEAALTEWYSCRVGIDSFDDFAENYIKRDRNCSPEELAKENIAEREIRAKLLEIYDMLELSYHRIYWDIGLDSMDSAKDAALAEKIQSVFGVEFNPNDLFYDSIRLSRRIYQLQNGET